MRITEYIKNEDDILLYNLSDNQKILDELELNKLPVNSTFLKKDKKNNFKQNSPSILSKILILKIGFRNMNSMVEEKWLV